MSIWNDLIGLSEPSALLGKAAAGEGMSHAWLITGPPGSGRSNLAYAFAAALLSPLSSLPEGDADVARQVAALSHPDLSVIRTDRVIIRVDEVRDLVKASYYSPSASRFRVMIIEDADRMTETTSNVLLKALEEPPEQTVWILCAPSEADLLPTIRSRVRSLRLSAPEVSEVADLIVQRTSVSRQDAERAAREAQSHIGMALRLASDPEVRSRHDRSIAVTLGVRTVTDAIMAAATLYSIADEDAKALTDRTDQQERDQALRSLGVSPGEAIPPALRGQVRQLEEDQKRRATRSLRDGLDRILVDLMSVYRDILMLQLDAPLERINSAIDDELRRVAQSTDAAATIRVMDSLTQARGRISANVTPLLALEAALLTLVPGA